MAASTAMDELRRRLFDAALLPAHPLALGADGRLDPRAQRALTRYYLEAGADGVAVGVHTTQFELHEDRGLLRDVWGLAGDVAGEHDRVPLLVAGIVGDTAQAHQEAELARELGFDAALLCPWDMGTRTEEALLERARVVGEVMPTIGFYLQDAVGGQRLSRDYWRRLFDIESLVAVKIAPFDRYRTNDVMQTLLVHDRWQEIAILTGNDDAFVHDLVTPYRAGAGPAAREIRATGGLLGQWAVGTHAMRGIVDRACAAVDDGQVPVDLLRAASSLVEINAAVFDVTGGLLGCVAGVNEVLRQQGLIPTAVTLGPDHLSPGQAGLIAEARARHPVLFDEDFIASRRDAWLA